MMSLLEKLRAVATADQDTDLLVFLGLKPGDPFRIGKDGVTAGNETVSLKDARAALAGPPILVADHRRTVRIGDL